MGILGDIKEKVKEKVEDIVEEVGETAEDIVEEVEEQVEDFIKIIKQSAEATGDEVEDLIETIGTGLKNLARKAAEGASVLLAGIAGALVEWNAKTAAWGDNLPTADEILKSFKEIVTQNIPDAEEYLDEEGTPPAITGTISSDDEEAEDLGSADHGYEYWYLIYPDTDAISITKDGLISGDSFALKAGLYSAITGDGNIYDAASLRTGVTNTIDQNILSGLDFDLNIDTKLLSDPDTKGITPFKVEDTDSKNTFIVGWAYGGTKRPKFVVESGVTYNVTYRGDTSFIKSIFSRYDEGTSFQAKYESLIGELATAIGSADPATSTFNFKKVKRGQIDYKKLSIFNETDVYIPTISTSTSEGVSADTTTTSTGGY